MKGLLLGLASGANCLATCAPMLLSLLAAEAGGGRQRFGLMGFFLLGRVMAYSALGALAWGCGLAVQQWPAWHSLVLGLGLMVCAVLLLRYGFSADPGERRLDGRLPPCVTRRAYRTPGLALAGGVVTGVNPFAPRCCWPSLRRRKAAHCSGRSSFSFASLPARRSICCRCRCWGSWGVGAGRGWWRGSRSG